MDYAGLQAALADWAARTDVTATIPSFVEFSTAMFNHGIPDKGVAPLRVREMEAIATLTPSSGAVTLPADYLQYIRVVEDASIRRELKFVTATYTDQAYPDRAGGLACDFTIIGSSLTMYPVSGNDIELTYFQAIPALSDSNTSNWLLAKQPSLYLHAGLMQLALYTKDNDLFSRSAALVTMIIDGLNATNELAIYARAGTRVQGIAP
ncbi:phage adaptor protein [Ensifer adhaerens]|uniref:phage adaptor protein n=1 Tax=Ensifer adhaerens TaxID=106592 RepID=UPI000CF11479|nr:hypothetical protein [Ensifer adhaerens]